MIKYFIFPVLLAVIAFFVTPMLGPEANGATRFFLVAVGIGLGVMINILFLKKKPEPSKKENESN